jgi:hypothetical protein
VPNACPHRLRRADCPDHALCRNGPGTHTSIPMLIAEASWEWTQVAGARSSQ